MLNKKIKTSSLQHLYDWKEHQRDNRCDVQIFIYFFVNSVYGNKINNDNCNINSCNFISTLINVQCRKDSRENKKRSTSRIL